MKGPGLRSIENELVDDAAYMAIDYECARAEAVDAAT